MNDTVVKRFIIFFVLFATVSCAPLHAQLQGQEYLDSMLKELPRLKEDTGKVWLIADISRMYEQVNPDMGIKYGREGLALATKLHWKTGIATSNLFIGLNYHYKSDFSTAITYIKAALQLFEEMGHKSGISTAYCDMGLVYFAQSDYPKALDCFFKSLKTDDLKEPGSTANVYCNIGSVYLSLKDYPKAIEYHTKSLKLFREVGEKGGTATELLNIGSIYFAQKNNVKTLEYSENGAKLFEEIGEKNGAAVAASNIADVYVIEKKYTLALAQFHKALKIAGEIGARDLQSTELMKMGHLYIAIVEDTTPGNGGVNDNVKYGHGIPGGRKALLDTAFEYLQKSLVIAKEIDKSETIMGCYEVFSKAYRISGEYKKSLEASDRWHEIKDSVFSEENDRKIMKMTMQRDYDKKDAQATLKLQRQKTYTYFGIGCVLLLLVVSFFIMRERGKSEKQRKIAESERKKSDSLLLNILPGEVAEELKAKGTTTARHYDHVTVIFTDFVNFTEAGERMSPQALIDELHICFKAFDGITYKYNIEKIKTIGDAYLAVCGLPRADPKHAEHVVRAATEMNAFMTDRLSKMGNERTFRIRIGIHSGSVVAGIVGVKKFAYDIWGDTVNTAARMEQHGEAGKVNISETTYELVKDKFTCEYRGEVEAKGKGVMRMYFVS